MSTPRSLAFMPGGSLIRRPWPGITTKTGFVFLYPQIDWGGSTPGYAETEFPMYPYMVSLVYKLFGFSDSYGRLLSAIFGVMAIYFMYRLVRLVATNKVALWSAFFLCGFAAECVL